MDRVVFKATRFFYASHLLNLPSRFGQHVAKDFAAHVLTKGRPWVETGVGNSMRRWRRMRISAFALGLSALYCCFLFTATRGFSQDAEDPDWVFHPSVVQPFWKGDEILDESVLFIRDPEQEVARGRVLFGVDRILRITNSAGTVIYEEGRDFVIQKGAREIVLPKGSRIASYEARELRAPRQSQKYQLVHRDGGDEILFGGKLEYHGMQTSISYVTQAKDWPDSQPASGKDALPMTRRRLANGSPLNLVLVGDSISTGRNASGWGGGPPFQPPYQELVRLHLERSFSSEVSLSNLSVSGKTSAWGLSKAAEVAARKPDLVMIAFGMNDAAGIQPEKYAKNISGMIQTIRETKPQCEFILIATMLGNRDWVHLKHERFPEFRDRLREMTEDPRIALADMTAVWSEMLKRKKDWDLTGNGVNHPNDFGHRVYAQVICELLTP